MRPSRPTLAEISAGALRHNFRLLSRAAGVPVMAVVKASAYGHGDGLAAPLLEKSGAASFGVATLEEALRLRRAGIRRPVVVLGAVDERALPEAAARGVGVTAWSLTYLRSAARRLRRGLEVHLKVDTGMCRLGFFPDEVAPVLDAFARGLGRLRLASAYTHLACADEARDRSSAVQIRSFLALPWPAGLPLHAANSAGALRYPEARLDWVRCGIGLYGALGRQVHALARRLRPVMRLSTRVLRVAAIPAGRGVSYGHTFRARRPLRVATLAAGYADGLPRQLSNRGEVLVGGRRCRILGRVCMDFTMADVTRLPRVRPGDEAVLLGAQGAERVEASEWASLSGTNAYAVLCGISPRVKRDLVD